jgi:hypothetical protein
VVDLVADLVTGFTGNLVTVFLVGINIFF